ncbi:helix-turn-helix domain-containing protein [Sporomusa acidovorans]|uniref:HTH cro/C1-type domain-containing protein n=1 Tax=Sporomusa acidovorans (strain ATCC 49682 / DSM 3132 / Mol) TaxID=1123286 RepID=A0ABZ3J7A8_SPOA4|nr:helix-turn-helix transcriptional regulator [Sporomusa acidovorans]OZC24196.1 HTH-type transcriptional regulator SinR [Sporomusa acidovorans DSM 3132]SDF77525.1 DNA-binding transcriptional regulator, XRE-family HTH domain [Sporomusa acidovorans]
MLGQHIRELRKSMKLTQDELALKANISRSYLADVERNRYNPSINTLESIAKALGITSAEILARESKLNKWDDNYNKDGKLAKEASEIEKQTKDGLPELTSKDEREIARDLEKMLKGLDSESGMAAFNEAEDEEDRELLKASLEYSMRLAKQIAKKKFTPKKYRKE